MKNWIIKSNQWYENLPEKKGSIFYLCLVFIPYILLNIILIGFIPTISPLVCTLSCGSWIILVTLWRVLYDIIKFYDSN